MYLPQPTSFFLVLPCPHHSSSMVMKPALGMVAVVYHNRRIIITAVFIIFSLEWPRLLAKRCVSNMQKLCMQAQKISPCTASNRVVSFSGNELHHRGSNKRKLWSFCALLELQTGTSYMAPISNSSSTKVASINKRHPICSNIQPFTVPFEKK